MRKFKEKFLLWFNKNKMLVAFGGVFLVLISFYVFSKYIRQEIVKNLTFAMPTIDVSKDNEKNALKKSDNEMLVSLQNDVDESKSKEKSALKVEEKGLKSFNGSKAFDENTTNTAEILPQNPVEKTVIIETPKVIQTKKRVREGERKVPINEVSKVIISENNSFNTTVLDVPTSNINPVQTRKKEMIKAAIYGTQTVRNNSSVRIRLLETITIDDEIIPTNSIGNGIAMMGGNRLIIMITAIKVGVDYIPTKMVVYDSNDMLPGIAYLSDNTKGQIQQQNNQAIDNIDNAVYNIGSSAGIAGQVGAGVITGISRSLRYGGVQKKAGEIELNEGYKIFLKQN